jgi:hypothetical protein
MVPGVCGVYHDDGIYVSTAKALASGQGYRLINLPDEPVQTKYPPLYPGMLAVIWKIWPSFPENLLIMQWLTILMMAMSVGFAYYYVTAHHYFSPLTALSAGLLCVTSNYFLYFGTILLSEMPFAFLFVVALLALERYMRSASNRISYQLLLAFLLTLPFLTRSVGVVLIPVALILLWLSHRPLWTVAIGAISLVLTWFLWAAIHNQGINPLASYYTITNYASWNSQSFNVATWIRVVFFNLIYFMTGLFSVGMPGLLSLGPLQPMMILLLLLLGIPFLIEISRGAVKRQPLPCFLAAYILVVIMWPWPPQRFIVPILLFLLCYWLNGLGTLSNVLRQLRYVKALAIVCIGVLVVVNIFQTYKTIQGNRKTQYPYIGTRENLAAWSSFEETFSWIRTITEPIDVIACPLDSMVFLYTARKSIRPFAMHPASLFYGDLTPAATSEQVIELLRASRAKYLVQTAMHGFSEYLPFTSIVNEIQQKYPHFLTQVYVGKDSHFVIFRLDDDFLK